MEKHEGQQLIAAARAADVVAVTALLARGGAVDVDNIDWMGRTALHRAARYGHLEVCAILLRGGSRAALWSDAKGRTPLDEAEERGHGAVAALLLHDTSVTAEPSHGMRFAAHHWITCDEAHARSLCEADPVARGLAYTPAEHRRFAKSGVHVFDAFLSSAGLDDASRRVDAIVRGAALACDARRLFNLHQRGERWISRLATHPHVLDAVRAHCGATFYFYLSHIIVKPPNSAYAVPWHQDYRYGADASPDTVRRALAVQRPCSVWIALDDVDAESGALHILPGAHAAGALAARDRGDVDFTAVLTPAALRDAGRYSAALQREHERSTAEASAGGVAVPPLPGVAVGARSTARVDILAGARALELRAGQAVIQDPLLPHCSPPNKVSGVGVANVCFVCLQIYCFVCLHISSCSCLHSFLGTSHSAAGGVRLCCGTRPAPRRRARHRRASAPTTAGFRTTAQGSSFAACTA